MDWSGRRERLLVLAGSGCVWLAAVLYAPYVHGGPTLCPLRLAIGVPCPGCGLTRALCSIATGHLRDAVAWNALCVPLALLLLAAPLLAAAELAIGRSGAWYRGLLFSPRVARIFGAAVALYHLGRCVVWSSNGTMGHQIAGSLAGLLYRQVTR